MTSIPVKDDFHWRDLRSKHVGASEVAALFSLSPWMTRWQLYMLKTGQLPDVFETKVMTQGKHFEPALAAYAQEKFKIQLRKVKRYMTSDNIEGMGASLDYEEYGDGALIPTELKFSLYGDGWEWEGDELTQIPDYYLMQVQHQLACCPGAPHGQLIAFTGGDAKRMIIPRSPRLITAIEAAVAMFWQDVRDGKEPPVDFSADADGVSRLAYIRKLRTVTLPPEMAGVMKEWHEAKEMETKGKQAAEIAKTKVLKAVLDAGTGDDSCVATAGEWRVAVSKVKDSKGTLVTPEMVGQYVGARKGHIRCGLKRVEE